MFSVQEEDVHGAHRRLSAEMIFIELVSQRIRKVTVKKSYFPFSWLSEPLLSIPYAAVVSGRHAILLVGDERRVTTTNNGYVGDYTSV